MTLYTYTLRLDDGSAPNPFHGMCTLAICKPAIRRLAQVGDWVVGLGSKRAPSGDLSGKLVYAMKVEQVLSLREYDRRANTEWPERIPDIHSLDMSRRLGDCIYDFSDPRSQGDDPNCWIKQRQGVHGDTNKPRDLRGENVLISRNFYYFGRQAIDLSHPSLKKLVHQTEGHKSRANAEILPVFEHWIANLGVEPGQLYGWPDLVIDWTGKAQGYGKGYGAPGWLKRKREKRLG